MTSGAIRAATDVGGTFTDLVYFSTDPLTGVQEIVTAKSDTTPPDFEQGVMNVLRKSGVSLKEIAFLAHGTTLVINALTERKGVKTGLITTEGFRDSLEIARGNRPDFFNLHYEKPPPFVPRYLRREVPGRMSQVGRERAPLDLSGLSAILDDFRAEGVEAVAICLLHSYADPSHEQAVLERVRELWPEVSVVASHQISREWREYERTSTTVLSACVQPVAERYLSRFAEGLHQAGFNGQLYIMQSNCGVDSVETTKQIPITMVESGPASGFWGAAELGRSIGDSSVLALDIGGTTAKCSLIEGGHVKIISDYWIGRTRRSAGYPIQVPVVDVVEIGNGGGSIAWVDDFGRLYVGPQSAGAVPGPAAYGRGGTEATTTDANLALGRINPDYFCGGEIEADMDAVDRTLGAIAQKLGVDTAEAARGVVRIANNNMINALKLVSVNRGYDPRDFTLVAFGGGGGMHAVALATELGIGKVVIPRAADVFSAWGMLMSDLRRDYFVTRLLSLTADNAERLGALLDEVTGASLEPFAGEGIAAEQVRFLRYGNLRYENQEHGVEVQLPDGEIDAAAVEEITENFHGSYEREYTYRLDAPVEFVGAHVVAIAEVGKLAPVPLPTTGRPLDDALKGRRKVDYATEGIHEAAVYDGELLEPGMGFDGPAIIETKGSTVVVHPGNELTVDDYGNLIISITLNGYEDGNELTTTRPDSMTDPVTLEIIQSSLQATSDEMFAALRKTAMSAIIYEVLDMGTGITDGEGNLASSGAGIPAFVGVLDKAVKRIIEVNDPGDIRPGDIFVTNDPYYGGVTHLNDVVLAMPVFADGVLIAWTANIAHWNDVGGMVPGSISNEVKEIFQEGLRLPAVKLISEGTPIKSVMEIMKCNSRLPDFLQGDMWAGIAAARVGERRILDLVGKYGLETFNTALQVFMDYGEQVALRALEGLPKGRFSLEEEQDSGAVYAVTVEITDDEFIVDLRGNPDQDPGPNNASRDGTMIAAQMVFMNITDAHSSANAGHFKPLKVLTRPGSVFDASPPAAFATYYEVEIRLYDVIWRCLAPHVGDRLPAGSFASICGTFIGGPHPDTGRHFTIVEPQVGGWGGSAFQDGNSAMFSGFHGDTFNCPAEVAETRYGLYVDRLALNEAPGGEGEHRGGRGIVLDYRVRSNGCFFTCAYTRNKHKPWPLRGGREGSPNHAQVIRRDGSVEDYAVVTALEVNEGDVIRLHTGTGGGYGDPGQRPPELVLDDLRNGYLTEEQARIVYGLD